MHVFIRRKEEQEITKSLPLTNL